MILQFEFTIRVYIDFLCRVKNIFLTTLFLAYQKDNRLKKKLECSCCKIWSWPVEDMVDLDW
jgi:hypothetical protein